MILVLKSTRAETFSYISIYKDLPQFIILELSWHYHLTLNIKIIQTENYFFQAIIVKNDYNKPTKFAKVKRKKRTSSMKSIVMHSSHQRFKLVICFN